jgi:hypothetical protein
MSNSELLKNFNEKLPFSEICVIITDTLMKQVFRFLLIIVAVPLCGSCMSRINGRLDASGAGNFTVSAGLLPRISMLIRMLSEAGGAPAAQTGADALIIDGVSITRSMSAAPGVASVSFKNTAPAAIEGTVAISQIGDFLGAKKMANNGAETGGFITFVHSGASGGRCSVTLNRERGPEILALLSTEIADYLSALMAPLATGEKLSKSEYLEAVESIYGKAVAAEISGSSIHASIEFPAAVQNITGGKASGRRAEFEIPLLDLLTLETPLFLEVTWK